MQIYPRHACREYLDSVDKFGFSVDTVPQLEDISQILQVRLFCHAGIQLASCKTVRLVRSCSSSTGPQSVTNQQHRGI